MTKSRLIYIAIMIIALLVLCWDKFINPNSVTQPQAGQAQSTQADLSDQPDDMSQWTNSPFVQRVLNQQKQQQESHQDSLERNLFAPTDLFRQKTNTPTADSQEKQLDIELHSELHLTSISKGSDKDCVLINGQIVRIGEPIGRYRLVQINREKVLLHTSTKHIILPLGDLTQPELREKINISTCDKATCLFK